MELIIAHAGKHGNTARLAAEAARDIPGARLLDLDRERLPASGQIKALVLLSSVYMGRPRRSFMKALERTLAGPGTPRLAVVTCGMDLSGDDREKIGALVGTPAMDRIELALRLPGRLPRENAGFLERLVIKAVEQEAAKQGAPEAARRAQAEASAESTGLQRLRDWLQAVARS